MNNDLKTRYFLSFTVYLNDKENIERRAYFIQQCYLFDAYIPIHYFTIDSSNEKAPSRMQMEKYRCENLARYNTVET